MGLDNTKIKSKTTLDTVLALNKLGKKNQVLIRWISAYLSNEKADTLAKRGANNTDATLLKLPITRLWRKKFSKSIHNLNRGNLRKATVFITGHVALNYQPLEQVQTR